MLWPGPVAGHLPNCAPRRPARITHGQRKVFLRLAEHWPWALALAKAFQRLRQIPLPA